MEPKKIMEVVAGRLEAAWNAADGAAFAAPFAPDADFVNIRGELHSGREAIGAGHQGIFESIYAGSRIEYSALQARELDGGVVLGQVHGTLSVPAGPMAGEHRALATLVVVPDGEEHRVTAFHNTLVAG